MLKQWVRLGTGGVSLHREGRYFNLSPFRAPICNFKSCLIAGVILLPFFPGKPTALERTELSSLS